MKEFGKYLARVTPTPEEIGDMQEEPIRTFYVDGDTGVSPDERKLERQRVRRKINGITRRSAPADHREPEKPHVEKYWRLPLLVKRREAIAQRVVNEQFALIEEPFAPDSLAGQTETAEPNNGLPVVVLYEGPATEPLGKHFPQT